MGVFPSLFYCLNHGCLLCNVAKRGLCRLCEFCVLSHAGAVVLTAFSGWGEVWGGQICHLAGRKVDTAVRNVDLSGTAVSVSPDNLTS